MENLIEWNIYEVSADQSILTGVKFRGRVRKFALQNKINFLAENASDNQGNVRFAIYDDKSLTKIQEFIKKIIPDAKIECVKTKVINPVLSKLKVNNQERYDI